MAEQEDTTMKEPKPNNPEEAKEYQKQTKIALQKFTDRIHSFDRYQHQSAYEFYVHDVLNELLYRQQLLQECRDLACVRYHP